MMGMGGIHAPIPNLGPGMRMPAVRRFAYTTKKAKRVAPKFVPFIVDTILMQEQEWADAFVYTMSPVLPLPQYSGSFSDWASQIAQEPQLSGFQLPLNGANWQEWAQGINGAFEANGAF